MYQENIGYLICETASTEVEKPNILGISNDRVQIEACIQDIDTKNRNGRYYAYEELVPKLKTKRLLELMAANSLFGEAGHPMSKDLSRQSTVDPTNMSHVIHKMWVDGKKIMSNISAAATSVGDDFHRLVLSGCKVAFSLRALGSVVSTNKGAEVRNINPITWDWVVYPSHVAAYMNKVINIAESVVEGIENHFMMEENDSGIMLPIDKKKVIEYIKDQSNNIKNVVESFEFLYESIDHIGNKVHMTDKNGDTLVISLEQHIQDEIRGYCNNR